MSNEFGQFKILLYFKYFQFKTMRYNISRIRYDSLFSFSDIGIFLCKPVISRNATSNAPSSRINSRREHFFVSFMRAPCSSLPLLLFFVCPTCVSHLLRSTKLRQFKLVTSSRLFPRIVSRSLNYALKLLLQFLDIFFFGCISYSSYGDE